MKVFKRRLHLGRKIKKAVGIKNNWSSRIFGQRRKSYQVASAGQVSDRRLANIS